MFSPRASIPLQPRIEMHAAPFMERGQVVAENQISDAALPFSRPVAAGITKPRRRMQPGTFSARQSRPGEIPKALLITASHLFNAAANSSLKPKVDLPLLFLRDRIRPRHENQRPA